MHAVPDQNAFDGIPLAQWDAWLNECRRNFGRTPRHFSADIERRLLVNPPWITRLRFGDTLAKLVQNNTLRRLFGTGQIVWGHVIQANVELHERAPSNESYTYDRPGEIVFAPEDRVHVSPQYLRSVAGELAGLRDHEELDHELQIWADYLNAETTRVPGWQVPTQLSPSASCFASTTLFRRGHLPDGILHQPLLPIVAATQQPYFAMPLPAWYWPESLLDWWATEA